MSEAEGPAAPRDQGGDHRDVVAGLRDAAATRRDLAASKRDDRAEKREVDESNPRRYAGANDRRIAAADRVEAAHDRIEARIDRAESAKERNWSSFDALTGAYRRDAGYVELARDLETAQHSHQSMVLGFLDVVGLKAVNDNQGHAAGDDVLRTVSANVRAKLRPHDLMVRFGGDEFLFSAVGLSLTTLADRLVEVDAALRDAQCAPITTGLAEVRAGETLDQVIDRADAELYRKRHA